MKKTRTRGFRILRNLAAAVLCAVPLWGLLGCPMPTPELRFRQLEDRSLVPRSQIVYLWENPFPVRTTSSGEPRHIVIGRSGGQYSVGYLDEPMRSRLSTMEAWPVGEGPTSIPLSQPLHRNEMDTDNVLLFLQVPEEAAEAELTITGRIENLIEPVETAQGEKMAEGVWMFRYPIAGELSADYTAGRPVRYGGRSLEGLPYTLELYREDGSLLWEQSGNLPDSGLEETHTSTFTQLNMATRFPHRPGGPGHAGKERRLAPWNTTKLQTPPDSGWTGPRRASGLSLTGRRSGRNSRPTWRTRPWTFSASSPA